MDRETVMRMWDEQRSAIAKGDKSSAPRDWFEALLDALDDERDEAILAEREACAPADGSANYGHNPKHAIGTCGNCGAEMVYNVPRLGPSGGFVHKATGSLVCENSPNDERIRAEIKS